MLMIWPTCYLPRRLFCSMSSYQIQAMRGWDEELLLLIRLTTTQGCLLPALSHKYSQCSSLYWVKIWQISSLLQRVGAVLYLGPGREVDLDTLMISRLAQSFRGMWTPGYLVKIFTVYYILDSDSVCRCLNCYSFVGIKIQSGLMTEASSLYCAIALKKVRPSAGHMSG